MGVFLESRLAEIPGTSVSNQPLAQLTTLHLGGQPRAVVHCTTTQSAIQVLNELRRTDTPFLLIGGGSNLVVADAPLDAIVVRLENKGVHISPEGTVHAEAGAVWDDVVAATVAAGMAGIECLSGIPGSAGATPVQNVGAYGAEVGDVLTRVLLWNRASGLVGWVPAAELELGYRHSNLKFTGRAVVLEIEMQLDPSGISAPLRWFNGETLPVAEVREKVLEQRRRRGMVLDERDHDTWSAGSFFTNPVVPAEVAERLRHQHPTMPTYPAPEGIKLSAAWLIERSGFTKGYPNGDAQITLSTRHTLALTNRGKGTTAQLVELAREIRAGVEKQFGVRLVPEPVWVGVSLD